MVEHNQTLIWIYSLSITMIISIVLFIFLKKKIYKFSTSKKEEKEKEKILNQLIFAKNEEINNFLQLFYDKKNIKKHKKYFLVLEKNDDSVEKTIVFYDFGVEKTSCEKILFFFKTAQTEKAKKMTIFCSDCEKNCQNFYKNIKNMKIKIVNFNKFYFNFMKKQGIYPNFEIRYEQKSKYSFKELFFLAFNKNKTKKYFGMGFIFLLGSIFMRYNIYYLIFTTLMFTFALFSYFNSICNKNFNES